MYSIKNAYDLVTRRDDTVKGFSWQANEKVKRADNYISSVDYFYKNVHRVNTIQDIRSDKKLTEFFIAACMLSNKSLAHFDVDMQNAILSSLIDFEKLRKLPYQEYLTQRYLLTSGDSLGGTMRNVVGQSAQDFLSDNIFEALMRTGKAPTKLINKNHKITAIQWFDRRIIFDKKPKFIDKSVDFIVLKGESAISGLLETPEDYVCCGELKGGIDPAGADEHWKTAKTALERIATSFNNLHLPKPKLIFIGAAIEHAMAEEIFNLLSSNWLSGAANLHVKNQLDEVVDIITS